MARGGGDAGMSERYSVFDLFPDVPPEFMPQVTDFQVRSGSLILALRMYTKPSHLGGQNSDTRLYGRWAAGRWMPSSALGGRSWDRTPLVRLLAT
jgi:hypothetical protein